MIKCDHLLVGEMLALLVLLALSLAFKVAYDVCQCLQIEHLVSVPNIQVVALCTYVLTCNSSYC